MYEACIRSILDYTALVWHPLMSISNICKIEILENRALCKIIGILISTRILDLYLEANA